MKVLLINGSPNEKGCTYTALNEIAETLNKENIDTEIYYIGVDAVAPCRDCRACVKLQKCVIDDKVNELLLEKQKDEEMNEKLFCIQKNTEISQYSMKNNTIIKWQWKGVDCPATYCTSKKWVNPNNNPWRKK